MMAHWPACFHGLSVQQVKQLKQLLRDGGGQALEKDLFICLFRSLHTAFHYSSAFTGCSLVLVSIFHVEKDSTN